MNTPPPKRVVGYIRGSTEEQQNTLEAQRQQITAYCGYKKLELVECFVDSGEHGWTSFYERPASASMLARMEELKATDIVITKLDRGFRDAMDCLFTINNLKERGLGLHLLDLQVDPNTPTGYLVIGIMAMIAQFENQRRSERQKAAFAVMKGRGQRCGGVPYGWDAISNGERASKTGRTADDLIPNPAEQAILRKIAELIDAGEPVSSIATRLNKSGIKAKKGGKWHPATVQSVYDHRRLAPTAGEEPTEQAA